MTVVSSVEPAGRAVPPWRPSSRRHLRRDLGLKLGDLRDEQPKAQQFAERSRPKDRRHGVAIAGPPLAKPPFEASGSPIDIADGLPVSSVSNARRSPHACGGRRAVPRLAL
jgi:hypothetical protein